MLFWTQNNSKISEKPCFRENFHTENCLKTLPITCGNFLDTSIWSNIDEKIHIVFVRFRNLAVTYNQLLTTDKLNLNNFRCKN